MEEEEEPCSPPSDETGDVNLADVLNDLDDEDILNMLRETPGIDEATIEHLRETGNFREFLKTLNPGSDAADSEAEADPDSEAVDEEPRTSQPVESCPPPPRDDSETCLNSVEPEIECIDVETESATIKTEPAEISIKTEPTEINPEAVVKTKFVEAELVIKKETTSSAPVIPANLSPGLNTNEKEVPEPRIKTEPDFESEDSPKSKHRDHHEKKKKKKNKHSRKLSSDSSESIKKHKAKKKHKDKENNIVKIKIEPAVKKYKHKFRDAAVIAVDINDIVLLKKHMVLRHEKVSKIEVIDREKRLSYYKEKGFVKAVFTSTRDKSLKFERKHSSSRPDKNSTKKKDEDKNKKRKRVYCASEDSESENDKPKHKKGNNSKGDKEKDGKHKDKEKFSASGARIMHYEKKYKFEQERIRRPKMPEPEPNPTVVKKEDKNKRLIGSNEDSASTSKKLKDLLAEAEKAKRQAATNFKIPKSRRPSEPEADLLPPSHTMPLPPNDPSPFIKVEEPRFRTKLDPFPSHTNQMRMRMENHNPIFRPPVPGQKNQRFQLFRGRNVPSQSDYHRPYGRFNRQILKPEQQPPSKATRLATYDDDNNDMIDLPSDDEEVEIAPPPITEVKFGDAAKIACKLLLRGSTMALPDQKGASSMSGSESIAYKVGWWFQTMNKDPVPWEEGLGIPEYNDDRPSSDYEDNGSVCSSFGNVSNPDNNDECQSNEVSSSDQKATMERNAQNPDIRDEYCGASLLAAKYRTSAEDTFRNIFELRPGTNYERENLQAKCTLCDELIVGKRHLGTHVRSDEHRDNLKRLSLNLLGVMTKPSTDKGKTSEDPSSTTSKRDSSRPDPGGNSSKTESKSSKSGGTRDRDKKEREGGREKNGNKAGGGNSDKMSVTSSRSRVNVMDEIVDRVSRTGSHPTHTALLNSGPVVPVVEEVVDRVSRTGSGGGSGISMRTPPSLMSSHRAKKSRSKSPLRKRASVQDLRGRRRSTSRTRTRSRSPRRRYSRSRSRSPQYSRRRGRSPPRRRSPDRRSPPRRKTSSERVAEFLEKTLNPPRRSRSPYGSYRGKGRRTRSRSPIRAPVPTQTKKAGLFPEKLKLQAAGLWTPAMEDQWKLMEAEEAALVLTHQEYRRRLAENPDVHPLYGKEWTPWWELKFVEVDNAGLDATNYDYAPEWKDHWSKRVDTLLADEYDVKLESLRLKYNMDQGTLQRLLLGIPDPPAPVAPVIPADSLFPIKVEVPILPVPAPVPAPGPTEIYSPFEDDFTARSMSVSSEGSRSRVSGTGTAKNASAAPVTAPTTPSTPVTVQTIQDTWALMTGQKISGSASDVGSTRSARSALSARADPDLEGDDVVQVLRLMTSSEDQLGILAPKVNDYFKRAEELESTGAKKSLALLEEKDFVVLLFQSRDKFNKLISANILPRDIMKKLNLTVFKLNLILDEEACQKFRPQVTAAPEPMEVVKHKEEPVEIETTFEIIRRSQNGTGMTTTIISTTGAPEPEEKKDYGKLIIDGLKFVSQADKIKIASIITTSLMAQQRESISDPVLFKYIYEIVEPIIEKNRHRAGYVPSPASSISSYSNLSRVSRASGNGNGPSTSLSLMNSAFTPTVFPGAPLPDPTEDNLQDIRIGGTALPRLPDPECRAVSPPHGYVGFHVQAVPPMSRPQNNGARGPGGPSPSSGYGQSPARATPPDGRPSPRIPSKSPRKENRQPDTISKQYKSSSHSSRTSSTRKDVGVAQEFWNSDASSVSSASMLGNDLENSASRNDRSKEFKKKVPESVIGSGGSTSGSITKRSNLRNQPKPKLSRNPEVSEAESGEILSEDDSLSSVSFTKYESGEDDKDMEKLGAIRGEISKRKRTKKRNYSSSRRESFNSKSSAGSGSDYHPPARKSRSSRRVSRSRSRSRSRSVEHSRKRYRKSKSKSKSKKSSNRKSSEKQHNGRKSERGSRRSRSRSRDRKQSSKRGQKSKSAKKKSGRKSRSRNHPQVYQKLQQQNQTKNNLKRLQKDRVKRTEKDGGGDADENLKTRHDAIRREVETVEIESSPAMSHAESLSPSHNSFRMQSSPFTAATPEPLPGIEDEVKDDDIDQKDGDIEVVPPEISVENMDSTPLRDEGDNSSDVELEFFDAKSS